VLIVGIILLSGGPDAKVRARIEATIREADTLLENGQTASGHAKYAAAMKLADQNPRERDAMRGDIETARLAMERARVTLDAEAKVAAERARRDLEAADRMRAAATRWVAATRSRTTYPTTGPNAVRIEEGVFKIPDNLPPTVKLVAPTDGAIFAAKDSVELSADASDPEGRLARVEFWAGDELLATIEKSPWRFMWASVPEGRYRITARVFDQGGESATSDAIEITLVRKSGAQ
jgi:hypothetical protein